MSDVVVGMTPFVYEDGRIYYFKIFKRSSTSDYHNLYVYRRKVFLKFFSIYIKLNRSPELVEVELKVPYIKSKIITILLRRTKFKIEEWDGVVGNVPEEFKKSLKREAKLKSIFDEN